MKGQTMSKKNDDEAEFKIPDARRCPALPASRDCAAIRSTTGYPYDPRQAASALRDF